MRRATLASLDPVGADDQAFLPGGYGGLHSSLPFVYDAVATNCRWVEAKILAPAYLGTESERSQWCNRLPEIVRISVADFVSLGRADVEVNRDKKRSSEVS